MEGVAADSLDPPIIEISAAQTQRHQDGTKTIHGTLSKNSFRRSSADSELPCGMPIVLTWCFFHQACVHRLQGSLRVVARGFFVTKTVLGEGSFAKVKLCVHKLTGAEFAIKAGCDTV